MNHLEKPKETRDVPERLAHAAPIYYSPLEFVIHNPVLELQ